MEPNKKIVSLCVVAMVFTLAFNGQLFGASATGDGTEQIHACEVLSMSILRMVDDPGDCTPVIEEAISWRVGPEYGTEFPLTCQGCILSGVEWIQGRNLSNAYLRSTELYNTDFSSSTFINANFFGSAFDGSDMTNADFTNAIFTGSIVRNTDMTGSDFTNADFSSTELTGSIGLATSSVDGVTWYITTCPDGTMSGDHGDTCLNHLSP